MSANSSSFNLSAYLQSCIDSTSCASGMIAFTVCSLLLVLPPCVYVVYLGLKQRRSGTAASHSDVFTFHMVAIELMNIVGYLLCSCAVVGGPIELMIAGMTFFSMNMCGQQLFHTLTCVERYLAVVHPVTYLGLKNQKGVRVRNVSIGCVWLLCFAYINTLFLGTFFSTHILSFCVTLFNFVLISFCSLSVLCVLIGPGPGTGPGGGSRQRVDQSKMRAFYTITVILGVLLLKLGGSTANFVIYSLKDLTRSDGWIVWLCLTWLSLPSSLLLPLLFLHRAGKLVCRKTIED